MASPTNERLDAIRALLQEKGAAAALLSEMHDVRWACGFTGSNGLLIVRHDDAHFITDGRYTTQARDEVRGAHVHVPGYDLLRHAADEGLLANGARVVVQADHVSVAAFAEMKQLFAGVEWREETSFLAHLVAPKDADALRCIRRAQQVTDEVFTYLLGFVEPGMTERDVAAELVYQQLLRGAEGTSFEPIVASGPNAALPHARPTNRSIRSGELLLLDFGCLWDGYASDMTRTVAVGDPGAEARAVYQVVHDAQQRAIDVAHAGITSKALDAAAREVIEEAGYGDRFTHSLGHGVGLQVHEWPGVSFRHDYELPENAVVTIEPGIYLPDAFGVRIEDMIVLEAGGCSVLTQSTKDLVQI